MLRRRRQKRAGATGRVDNEIVERLGRMRPRLSDEWIGERLRRVVAAFVRLSRRTHLNEMIPCNACYSGATGRIAGDGFQGVPRRLAGYRQPPQDETWIRRI